MADVVQNFSQHLSHRLAEVIAVIGKDSRKIDTEGADALSHGDPIFQAECPGLVDQTGAAGDKLISHPMQSLHIDLLNGPHLREAHRWPGYSLGNGLGIDRVVLL